MSDLIERLQRTEKYIRAWGVHDLKASKVAGELEEAAAALRSAAEREARLREALEEIDAAHIPDCPMHFGGDELEWAQRHVSRLRQIARAALAAAKGESDA